VACRDNPGLAFVVVTHLSPNRESMLPEIVARFTSLPVHPIADGTPVEVDSVYLLPSDAVLGIKDRTLYFHPQVHATRERRPIDVFFGALSADIGELAAGVVLSGADSDGTLGIKAIKERGGLTLAQVPDSFGPHHADMPDSAIATGLVDFAIPVEQMAARLADFARGVYALDGIAEDHEKSISQAQVDEAREAIYTILRNQVGHDFSGYETKTFLRRIQRRMQILQMKAPEVPQRCSTA
jgi:two-component system CheB/CheR fusion protein